MFGSSSSFGAFGQNPLNRTQSSPSKTKALPTTPSQPASIFSTSHLNRTITAPPFRNPAFTTPRKPFDADAYSEASPAESSPAATDVSDLTDTPENDRSYDLDHMTITPASLSRHKNNMASSRKQSGKGELMHTVFSNRDKVRKRKRYNENKDISGYRLPYRQHDEWDETDYDSDESTIEPGRPSSRHVSRGRSPSKNKNSHGGRRNDNRDGWLSNFLSVIQRHPHAPAIMSYWLSTLFNFVVVFISFYFVYVLWSVLSEDFLLARRKARDGIVAEIERCTTSYTQNKCHPIESRLPAMHQLCDDWYECMLQNENGTKTVHTVILELADVLNSAVGSLHYKTLVRRTLFIWLLILSHQSVQLDLSWFHLTYYRLLTCPTISGRDNNQLLHFLLQRLIHRQESRRRRHLHTTADAPAAGVPFRGVLPPPCRPDCLGADRAPDAAPLQSAAYAAQ